jgi:hypothetical protein
MVAAVLPKAFFMASQVSLKIPPFPASGDGVGTGDDNGAGVATSIFFALAFTKGKRR